MSECNFELPALKTYLEQLKRMSYQKKIPLEGVFELTPECNFKCNMCYVHLTKVEMEQIGTPKTKEEWISLAKAAKQAGTLQLTLTGGEVFVRPDFFEIYHEISKMGFLIQILTNGFCIDKSVIAQFAKNPPYAIRITLYGASDASYKAVCGVENGFSKVKQAIQLLKEAGILVYLAGTITKENEHELDDMTRFAYENGLSFLHMSNLVSSVRGASTKPQEHQVEFKLPPKEIIEELRNIRNRYPKKTKEVLADYCSNYKKGYWITWDGHMQLCAFLTNPFFLVTEENFLNVWECLQKEVELLKQPKQCNQCSLEDYCDKCLGTLYTETQGVNKPVKQLCKRAKFNYELYKKG